MRITTLLLFVFISINILPQNDNTITIANVVTLKSSYLGEDRQIFISFPPGYDQGNAKYPVLFVLDGNQHFHYASGIVNYLSTNGKIPHTLVVGIPNANRNRDFTPTASENVDGSGGGNNFLDFLEKELIPYVDDNYRTSQYRILFGHSLTGMFSIYTLSTRPDLFSAYLAASPYLQYDDNYAVEVAQNEISSSYNKSKFLYMTIGNEPDYYPVLDQLTGVFKSKNPDNLEWDYVKLEKDDHTTIPIKTLDAGITAVFSDWALPQNFPAAGTVETLKEHFNLVAKKYGQEITATEGIVNNLGYQIMAAGRIDEALKIFEYNIELYPNSANVYDSYGEGLEAANRFEHAKNNYEKAIKIGTEKKDPNLAIYTDHLNAVKVKIK